MESTILLKRSLSSGSIPITSSIQPGELAINVPDGKVYLRKSGSGSDTIQALVTTNTQTSGSININGNLTITGSIIVSSSIGDVFDMFADTFIFTGSMDVSGSIEATSFTGSLQGTSSYALTAQNLIGSIDSASYAATASYVLNAVSASRAVTASYVLNAVSSSYALSASRAVTSSYALNSLTASYALNGGGGGISGGSNNYISLFTGSNALTSSIIYQSASNIGINTLTPSYKLDVNGSGRFSNGLTVSGSLFLSASGDILDMFADTFIFTGSMDVSGSVKSTSFTGSLQGTASYATTASYALNGGGGSPVNTGSFMVTASVVNTTITFTKGDGSTFDVTVSQSGSVSTASYALFAENAANASTASYILNAVSASRAVTSSYALNSLTASYAFSASKAINANTASYVLNAVSSSYAIIPNNLKTIRFEMGVSSTSAITTGAKGRKTIPYNGTITGWKLVSDQNTTTTIDIWKLNNSIPTVANTITAAAKPSLSAAQLNDSTTLTGWTTSVSSGDVFILNVDANNNANYISLELDILLTN